MSMRQVASDAYGYETPFSEAEEEGGSFDERPASFGPLATENPYAVDGFEPEDGASQAGTGAGFVDGTVLRKGARGADVRTLQQVLARAGFAVTAGGIFDTATEAAVRAFQSRAGLTADGIVGRMTRRALLAATSGAAPSASAGPTPARAGSGRLVVDSMPMLRRHRGSGPDCLAKWVNVDGPGGVTVVVHFHGYSGQRQGMRIDRHKEAVSGLDFADPTSPGAPMVGTPTIAILPRGNYFGGKSGMGYNFPALTGRGELQRLIDDILARISQQLGYPVTARRLVLTGHSGGGAPLDLVLAHMDPDEVHIFDGTYGSVGNIARWARRRIAQEIAVPTPAPPALRVLFRPGTGTQKQAVRLCTELCASLGAGSTLLRNRFRCDQTKVAHNDIPRVFGWRLLVDAGADLPGATTRRCKGASVGETPEFAASEDGLEAEAQMNWIRDDERFYEEPRETLALNASDLDFAGNGEELAWLDFGESEEEWDATQSFFEDTRGEDFADAGEAYGESQFGRATNWGENLFEEGPEGEEYGALDEGPEEEWEESEPGFSGEDTLETLLEGEGFGFADTVMGAASFALGPTLQRGSKGKAVETLQGLLNRVGASLTVDGDFGPSTERALKAFQQGAGQSPSGVADGVTKGALVAAAMRSGAVAPSTAPGPAPSSGDLGSRIAQVAVAEWEKWHSGGRNLKETQSAAVPLLQRYYQEGVGKSISAGDLQSVAWQAGHPWSAVFVSYCMRTAGAGSAFRYSSAHWVYVAEAKRNRVRANAASPFWAYRPDEVSPQIGDLVCATRAGSGATYDTIDSGAGFKTHCDIVTEISGDKIRVIGGNVRQDVGDKWLKLRADGRLDLSGNQAKFFAIVRCRGAAGSGGNGAGKLSAPLPAPQPSNPGGSSAAPGKRLSPREFVATYRPAAIASLALSGVPVLVTLGQAALESGWGERAAGYNFFGIKALPSDPMDRKQLWRTREVHKDPNRKYPEVISVTRRPDGLYEYRVRDWFKAYPDAGSAFLDHGQFLRRYSRYSSAFRFTGDPYRFAEEVARAGYATDPKYRDVLHSVMRTIEKSGF